MRILALATWWPEPADNGIRLRLTHLLRALTCEHSVHFVALADNPPARPEASALATMCASVAVTSRQSRALRPDERLAGLLGREPASVRAGWNSAFATRVRERAEAVKPDLVLAFELGAAIYARVVPGVPRILEDLESTHMADQVAQQAPGPRRARAWLTWWKHRRFVADLLHDFALCTVASEREQILARTMLPPHVPVAVIPNGADVEGCAGPWGPPEPDTLIYPGSLTYNLNFDAMHYFLGEIFPAVRARRPGARLVITGKTTPELRAALPSIDGVEFPGLVPDIRPVVARAWAEVVPLRYGSGTRLKVLEALALGTPVITTPKGVEGLKLDHDRHVLLAGHADAFASATVQLLEDGGLRERLAGAGRTVVQELYDWRVIGRRLTELVCQAAAARQPVAGARVGRERK